MFKFKKFFSNTHDTNNNIQPTMSEQEKQAKIAEMKKRFAKIMAENEKYNAKERAMAEEQRIHEEEKYKRLQELEAKKEQLLKEEPFEELLAQGRNAISVIDTFILKICLKHITVLINKYNQLVYKDDYGVIIYDDYIKEIHGFVQRFIFNKNALNNPETGLNKVRPVFVHIADVLSEYFDIIEKIENISFVRSDDRDNPFLPKLSYYTFCSMRHAPVDTVQEIIYEDERGIKWIEDFSNIETLSNQNHTSSSTEELNAKSLYDFVEHSTIYWISFFITSPESIEEFRTLLNVTEKTDQQQNTISPIDYEQNICLKLKELGFSARVTKASCDQGVDVLAEKNDISFAIQCKMYSHPVGNKAVQEVSAGKQHYNTDYGVVVSNSSFTKSAKQLANSNDIILLNDNQLEQLLKYTE